MDMNALRRKPRMSSAKNTTAARAESSPLDVEEICVEAATKRSIESSAPDRAVTSRPGKWVKIAVIKHKSRHASEFGQGVLHPTLTKDLYTLPPEILMAQAAKQITLADDELLRLMRENKTLKIELPSKSVADYKQSVGFGWGLQRMGQVSYEYGYRVALAHFQARYPDLEMDSDPFTEKPEDSSVRENARAFSDHFDDLVWTLPGRCRFTLSSGWITYLGFAQDEVARGYLPRTYFAIVEPCNDFLVCEFPEMCLGAPFF
ncbi:hypothetical protein BHE74_00014134 [Ensete ventricosum]|nr:hypothetical protein BHE74_00014134 [Ensete ventricosum]RZR92929.1 hypothetical protein BHM03_00021315 [Ensete ventricosum]